MSGSQPTDPIALAALAVRAAEEAGRLVAEHRRGAATGVATKTSATDMVTATDRAAEALVVATILAARPDDGLLGEEGTVRAGSTGVRWIVDPLDGTTNFLYGFPACAVAVAAEVDGRVVAGAVHDPVHYETFAAVAGGGATLNGEPVRVGQVADLAGALVGTGFSYLAANRTAQARMVAHVLPRVRDIRRAGAAALDLCWVACGRLDAYYERHLQPWDIAAAALVATEAGAAVTGLDGAPLDIYRGEAAAAGPSLAPAFLDLLAEAGAEAAGS